MGHTMIGIEYSRFSQISKRYERYKLQYGFYPVSLGTFSDKMAKGVNDIIVPGKMMDDAGHTYTVSRRYPATAKQVNAILQASETYADGGYGCYARNCTTFVKDMAEMRKEISTLDPTFTGTTEIEDPVTHSKTQVSILAVPTFFYLTEA